MYDLILSPEQYGYYLVITVTLLWKKPPKTKFFLIQLKKVQSDTEDFKTLSLK